MKPSSSEQQDEEESDILGDLGVKKVRETMKLRAKNKKKAAANNSQPSSPNLDDSVDDPSYSPPRDDTSAVIDDVSANDQVRISLYCDLASVACSMLINGFLLFVLLFDFQTRISGRIG